MALRKAQAESSEVSKIRSGFNSFLKKQELEKRQYSSISFLQVCWILFQSACCFLISSTDD